MNEKRLIRKARQGDARSISRLYALHKDQVYKFIYFKVGSQADAEDLFQDVMMAAFQSLDRYRGEVPFLHWCYQIARNKIAYFWRQHYQKPTVKLDDNLALEEQESVSDEELDLREGLAKERVDQLLAEIEPPRYGELLRLRFLESKTLREVAEALEITLNNAKVLQNRALKKATQLLVTT